MTRTNPVCFGVFQKIMTVAVVGAVGLLAGCGAPPPAVPVQAASPTPQLTLVWVGRGEAERFEKGQWARIPAFDYEFTVEQRRFADHWESIKTLVRRHPDYDGSAGPREQVLYFRVDYTKQSSGVSSRIQSSLGKGEGTTDPEFREASLTMKAEVSSFAPFNTYRITQHYRYEQGELSETVELLKANEQRETPWVRNQEQASLFGPRSFEHPPSAL